MLTGMSTKQLLVRPATDSDAEAAFKLMAELGYPDLSPSRFAGTL
jgi:hypothetical protein